MKPEEFIAELKQAAQDCERENHIPASFSIAQAALESAWGKSRLAREGRNLFGVKADRAWKGDVLEMPTRECRNGCWCIETARWRKYVSWLECFEDHAAFLKNNKRYRKAFETHSGQEFAKAIAAAGYATDPDYAKKLCQVIRAHDLESLDRVAA